MSGALGVAEDTGCGEESEAQGADCHFMEPAKVASKEDS